MNLLYFEKVKHTGVSSGLLVILVVVIVVFVVVADVAVVTVAFVQITPAAFEVLQIASELFGQSSKDNSFPRHLTPLITNGVVTGPKNELEVGRSALKYLSCLQTTLA